MKQDASMISEARRLAASTPAAKTTTHGSRRRGVDHKWHKGPWKHPAPRPQPWLSSPAAVRLVFWSCMAIGALSIGAQLTGHAETLRTMWHQTP
ncbi:hypothetical protein RA19_00335 [Leisingera sp. ANG-M1]|uniref:hypothetical protein n=1 Tax=Leisingera sp. ANG-M1 TaxID=1577895 RepID=UPI0005801B97|nr:hypothetical protein [Leisingera sp. ANG-M1]KIC12889.1 hypothetical protein RA19_00335 [Leisingera sp. ANG-M1]